MPAVVTDVPWPLGWIHRSAPPQAREVRAEPPHAEGGIGRSCPEKPYIDRLDLMSCQAVTPLRAKKIRPCMRVAALGAI